MTATWVAPERGIHVALGTNLDEDVPTHVIVKIVSEEGHSIRWAMDAPQTRQLCAGLLDLADQLDP
ncbi:MAG: hypothetical protein H0T61_06945 [Actinobacteria bacterium]|nr:hypothetical protein [Actinomycetota bacterium]